MVNSREYVLILKAAHDCLPKIEKKSDEFYALLDYMRKQYHIIKKEFECYVLYLRHDTSKLFEAVEFINSYCKEVEIKAFWAVPISQLTFTEDNWSSNRKIKQLAQFHYNGVNITKLIDF
jgi:hypothetical protein